jgi:hypothetical protein
MSNLAENHAVGSPPGLFAYGKADPSECGRLGGHASVLSRRLAGQKRLEEKIVSTKNGAALYSLLRDRRQREAELERQRLAADRELVAIEEWTITAKEELESTLAELERARSEREAQLEAAKDGDHDALADVLRAAGEEATEVALSQLGWLEDAEAAP